MKHSAQIHKVSEIHQLGGLPKPKHPLVSVIYNSELKNISSAKGVRIVNNLYTIIFKSSNVCSTFSYGRNVYDHEEGTIVFTAPGQIMEFDDDPVKNEQLDPNGWSLVFHPDLFRKSELANKMNKYSFFYYESNEALHVSNEEKESIEDLLKNILDEYNQTPDKHSQNLIITNIELFLDYCLRFYDRQFFSRTNLNTDNVSKFERVLINYYKSNQALEKGVPNVEYCATELKLSPNYLSDLLKKETGKTTLEHIHLFLIDKAKTSLLNSSDNISEIAYSLGFEYPQRFSNLFKSKTGMSPTEYRHLN